MFGKPKVSIELDETIPGTPFRTCSILIETASFNDHDLERVQAALARLVSSPEVSVAGSGPDSLIDRRNVVRLRMSYYGSQLDGQKVAEAVRSVL